MPKLVDAEQGGKGYEMIEADFVKLEGRGNLAPYIDIGVIGHHCMCRLDTGADRTVLPTYMLESFKVNQSEMRIQFWNWTINRLASYVTYRGCIFIDGRALHLEKVLATPRDFGLLGLDVLNRFALLMEGGTIILE